MQTKSLGLGIASLLTCLLVNPDAQAQEPVVPAAPADAPGSAGGGGQKENGFLLGVNLGTGPTLLSSTTTPVGGQEIRGGLLLGYKYGRIMGHFGLEYSGADSLTGASTRFGSIVFWLGVTGAIWRSSDLRVELIGSVRLGPGVAFTTGTGSNNPTALVGYELTPGLRYYFHPSVGVQAQAGLGGQYFVTTGPGSTSVGAHSLVASLGAILVL